MKVVSFKFTKVSELRTLLQLLLDTEVTDSQLIWAVNLHYAEFLLSNLSRAEFVEMLQNNNIVTYRSIQGVMEYIATYIHVEDNETEFSYAEFIVFVIEHTFGNLKLAQQLMINNDILHDLLDD